MDKLDINIHEGLKLLHDMIKPSVIAEACGLVYVSYINKVKQNCTVENYTCFFSDNDIEKVNSALIKIGRNLQSMRVPYKGRKEDIGLNETREAVKKLSSILQMSYIYTNILKKDRQWFNKRIKPYNPETKNYYFSEDDIVKINLLIIDISNKLLSINLIK